MAMHRGLWQFAISIAVLAAIATGRPVSAPRVLAQVPAKRAAGPLRVHPGNPRYFTDGTGKAIYLTGSHTWDIFQRWLEGNRVGNHRMGRPADFDAYLAELQAHQHNFIRFWVADTAWSPVTKAAIEPQPYVRTGPGTAAGGGLKFDLTRLNPAYFEELRARVIAARGRGMYVGVMLFNGWGVGVYQGSPPHDITWDYHPFHKANNINGIDGDPNGDRRGLEYHGLQVAAITRLQETYVRKVVDTVNDLDNVLYEISNESGPTSVEWQYHLIRYVQDYERTKPQQHPVIMSGGWGMANADLFAGPADAVAPGAVIMHRNPRGPTGIIDSRPVIIDSDHNESDRTDPQFVWKCFLRGTHPIVMDWWDGDRWKPIRQAMGQTRRYADTINLAAMRPRNDLASTTYCLADPGKEYLVYLPDGGAAMVDVSAAQGKLIVEWFNPRTNEQCAGGRSDGGAKRRFQAPFGGDAVLYLRRE